MRKVVIAPDSFKESLTALEAADAIEEGFRQIFPDSEYVRVPMADGGEGTLQSLIDATHGEMKQATVTDPMGQSIQAAYGIIGSGKQAVIEMATASGLELVPLDQRDPMKATSWGLGDLIRAVLDDGVSEIIIGIGGSATNDGGAGMVQSLGGKLLDKNGEQIPKGGAGLRELERIDLSEFEPRLAAVRITVASDVDNPLTGEKGASYIYGPQKGATEEQVRELDENLQRFADVIQRDLAKDVTQVKGAGAAGGVGAALMTFMDAEIRRGGELIAELLDLTEKLKASDLVITGEGGINHQTIYGKTPIVVAKAAKQFDLPVIAIAGSLSEGFESVYEEGIDAVFSILPEIVELETALDQGYENLVKTARNIAALLKI